VRWPSRTDEKDAIMNTAQPLSGRTALVTGDADMFTKIDMWRAHYASLGLGENFVD
jgi:hypothetical protein